MPAIRTAKARIKSSIPKQLAHPTTAADGISKHPITTLEPPSKRSKAVRESAAPDSALDFPTGLKRVGFRLPDGTRPSASAWKLYDALLQIPSGRVVTYGELARAMGSHPRAMATILRWNPFAPAVPCHRVIERDHFIGGYQGASRHDSADQLLDPKLAKKLRLLEVEGVSFDAQGKLYDESKIWNFP